MSERLEYFPDLPIRLSESTLAFEYGPGIFAPQPEMRRLDAIRPSLLDPRCQGPDPVYGIAMDIGLEAHRALITHHIMLFGAVVYASGSLGSEPVRSQGHIHAISPHSGWSAPEVFEIWSGNAIVYAQQFAEDQPGRCIAVSARAGDKVVMPPNWAHCVINADPNRRMAFGAWCDRQYGFDYTGVRAHHGLAWFPTLTKSNTIEWQPNPNYQPSTLEQHDARTYPELGLDSTRPLYSQFVDNPETLLFVSDPQRAAKVWPTFAP
jgi:glucose-6-phosphate isomerase